eukprot:COSAG02_NODE_1629_length_11581_cov_5.858735_6_plen_156_part_00
MGLLFLSEFSELSDHAKTGAGLYVRRKRLVGNRRAASNYRGLPSSMDDSGIFPELCVLRTFGGVDFSLIFICAQSVPEFLSISPHSQTCAIRTVQWGIFLTKTCGLRTEASVYFHLKSLSVCIGRSYHFSIPLAGSSVQRWQGGLRIDLSNNRFQ